MNPERWQKLLHVFDEAIARGPAERREFVRAQCADDEELERAVERMVHAHETDAEFMSRPVLDNAQVEGDPELPEAFGYRIVRKLGAGGMGVVYLAEQVATGRRVALKVVNPWLNSPSMLRRFEYEVRTLAQLHHPGIAQVHEAGAMPTPDGSRPFFAMEYVEGTPLLEFARAQSPRLEDLLDLFLSVCAAVQHAHQKGIIHRDLKPANILVTGSGQPKILDFGVARMIAEQPDVSTLHTREGQLVGTLGYMSPEQIEGETDAVDTRADVYALGVILHELLTGRPPFDLAGKNVIEAARVIREEEPTRLSTVNRTYRGDLDIIASKALAKEKERRYASVAELAADIERFRKDEPIVARPSSAWYQVGKFARRNKGFFAVGGLSGVGITAALCVSIWFAVTKSHVAERLHIAEQEERTHRREAERSAAVANAVVQFMTGVIASVNPSGESPSVTIRQALDAVASREGPFSPDQRVDAAIRHTVGRSYLHLGLADRAMPLVQQAQRQREAELGPDHEDTLASGIAVADALKDQGEAGAALELVERVLAAASASLGADSRVSLSALCAKAQCLDQLDRVDEAEAALVEVRTRAMAALGPEDDITRAATHDLGGICWRKGDVKRATSLWTETLEIETRLLGPKSLMVLLNRGDLVLPLLAVQRHEEAEKALREILPDIREIAGADHPRTLTTMFNLGHVLMNRGKLDEAETVLRETLAGTRRRFGDRHPETIMSMSILGDVLKRRGQYKEAEELALQAERAFRGTLGPKHHNTLSAMSKRADIIESSGDLVRAEELAQRVLELSREAYGEDGEFTLKSINRVARIAVDRGEPARAEGLLAGAIERATRRTAQENPGEGFLRHTYGRCLTKLGKFEAAEGQFRDGLAVMTRLGHSEGSQETIIRDFYKGFVELYELWGKDERAAEYKGKLSRSASPQGN